MLVSVPAQAYFGLDGVIDGIIEFSASTSFQNNVYPFSKKKDSIVYITLPKAHTIKFLGAGSGFPQQPIKSVHLSVDGSDNYQCGFEYSAFKDGFNLFNLNGTACADKPSKNFKIKFEPYGVDQLQECSNPECTKYMHSGNGVVVTELQLWAAGEQKGGKVHNSDGSKWKH